jgi:hypothetical protein
MTDWLGVYCPTCGCDTVPGRLSPHRLTVCLWCGTDVGHRNQYGPCVKRYTSLTARIEARRRSWRESKVRARAA